MNEYLRKNPKIKTRFTHYMSCRFTALLKVRIISLTKTAIKSLSPVLPKGIWLWVWLAMNKIYMIAIPYRKYWTTLKYRGVNRYDKLSVTADTEVNKRSMARPLCCRKSRSKETVDISEIRNESNAADVQRLNRSSVIWNQTIGYLETFSKALQVIRLIYWWLRQPGTYGNGWSHFCAWFIAG